MNGASTPAEACDAPSPTRRTSNTLTRAPAVASSYAQPQPMTPAPTTITWGCDTALTMYRVQFAGSRERGRTAERLRRQKLSGAPISIRRGGAADVAVPKEVDSWLPRNWFRFVVL